MMNGSRVLEGFVPDVDATVVSRILEAGGRILGKAVCENLCFDGASFTSATGPVLNPHDQTRMAGGSSSGSAALVRSGSLHHDVTVKSVPSQLFLYLRRCVGLLVSVLGPGSGGRGSRAGVCSLRCILLGASTHPKQHLIPWDIGKATYRLTSRNRDKLRYSLQAGSHTLRHKQGRRCERRVGE